MKVYLELSEPSRGIQRVRDALVKYAPKEIKITFNQREADLTILHVYGRYDRISRQVESLRHQHKAYAMIQYAIRSTMRPDTHDWIHMWKEAKLVWSYYNLPELCKQDAHEDEIWADSYYVAGFPFYYSPLGVDPDVFKENPLRAIEYRPYIIMASSQHALAEGARECAFAVKNMGGTMFFLGHELRRGNDIVCRKDISDKELAKVYSKCQYVSGLRRIEGFEFPVIEGALCGARPIVFDRPHYREWFKEFAVFIPEEPREKVIKRLTDIFTHPTPPVSPEHRELIRQRFNWETIIKGFWGKIL